MCEKVYVDETQQLENAIMNTRVIIDNLNTLVTHFLNKVCFLEL